MAYTLRTSETIEDNVRRVAGEQIADAQATAADSSNSLGERIHEVRKTCKKLRGLLRLVRPVLGNTYSYENRWFRDTARLLADLRDAQTVVATLDELTEKRESGVDDKLDIRAKADRGSVEGAVPVRQLLVRRRDSVWSSGDKPEDRLAEAVQRLAQAAERVPTWTVSATGASAFRGGLKKTYRRARTGYRIAAKHSGTDTEKNHEWRKRVKYHWYHLRLLSDCWPGLMDCWTEEAHRLSSLLGSEHDLAVLRDIVVGELLAAETSAPAEIRSTAAPPDGTPSNPTNSEQADPQQAGTAGAETAGSADEVIRAGKEVLRLIAARRESLVDDALSLGGRLFAEKPKSLINRVESYWAATRTG